MNARDAALLRRWSEHRDAEAFNDLVSHYADMVYATCKRTLGNPSDAEELTQECFLKLATSPERIRTSLGGWLHSVATSLSINRLRSDARRRKREEIAVAEAPSTADPIWDELQRHVDEAIAELPEGLREPLIRHFLQRETHDQIAQDLGVTRWTVSRRIATGIERVHKRLTKGGIALTAAALTTLASERMVEAAPASLKASLGRLALSAVPQSVAVGATGMTLLAKALAVVAVTVIIGAGATIAHNRAGVPASPSPRQQPFAVSPKADKAETKLAQRAAQPTPSAAAVARVSKTASVFGRVYDKNTLQGIPGAEVSLAGDAGREETQTNERGEYQFDDVAPGTWYSICDKANGYYRAHETRTQGEEISPNVRKLTVEPGRDATGIDFALGRGEGVAGTVVDADGKPLAGAKVTAYTEINNCPIANTSESREDGSFTVFGFPPTVGLFIWAEKGNLVSVTNGPCALPKENRTLNPVVLQPEAILRGVIQDIHGRPAAGLKVTPQFMPATNGREVQAESGPDGRFDLRGIPAGSYLLRVCREVYRGERIVNTPCPSISLAPGQVVDDLVLACTVAGQTISGQVVDSQGNGLSWARVEYTGGEPPHGSSTDTDNDGRFVIEALEPGTYTLYATHTEHLNSESVEVAAGSANIRFVLPDAVSVEGRVVDDATGETLTGYEIKYAYYEDEMYLDQRYEKPENPDGSFKLKVAHLGDKDIVTRREGYRMNVTPVPVDGKQPVVANVLIRLKPQADLRGKVHDAKGAPVVGALVFSGSDRTRMEDSYASARSGDDGGFVLPARKLANDTITVFHPNFPKTEMALEPKHYAGEFIDVAIVAGTRLACTVLCNGAPYQGGIVSIHVGRGGKSESTTTGPDGKGLIETLPPGEYHAEIQMPPSADQTTGAHAERMVSLAAGQTTDLTVDFAQGDTSVTGEVDSLPKWMRMMLTVATAQGEQKYYRFFREGETKDPSFSFPNLPAGKAVLKVLWTPAGEESDNAPARRYAFSLTPGASIRQDVKLNEGAALWGTVGPLSTTERTSLKAVFGDHASEDPYSDEVNLDHCANVPLSPDGTFRMEGLQPGVYTVIATACPLENAKPDQLRNVSVAVNLSPQGQEVNLQLPR